MVVQVCCHCYVVSENWFTAKSEKNSKKIWVMSGNPEFWISRSSALYSWISHHVGEFAIILFLNLVYRLNSSIMCLKQWFNKCKITENCKTKHLYLTKLASLLAIPIYFFESISWKMGAKTKVLRSYLCSVY